MTVTDIPSDLNPEQTTTHLIIAALIMKVFARQLLEIMCYALLLRRSSHYHRY